MRIFRPCMVPLFPKALFWEKDSFSSFSRACFARREGTATTTALTMTVPSVLLFGQKDRGLKMSFVLWRIKAIFPFAFNFSFYTHFFEIYLGLLFQSCFLNFAYSSFPFWFCARHLLCPLSLGRRDLRSVLWF